MSGRRVFSFFEFAQTFCFRDPVKAPQCLLPYFQEEIILLARSFGELKRLIIRDGSFEELNRGLLTRLLPSLQKEAEEALQTSAKGREYLEFGSDFLKQIVFCGFCLRSRVEVEHEKRSDEEAKVLFVALMYHYLYGRVVDHVILKRIRKIVPEKEQSYIAKVEELKRRFSQKGKQPTVLPEKDQLSSEYCEEVQELIRLVNETKDLSKDSEPEVLGEPEEQQKEKKGKQKEIVVHSLSKEIQEQEQKKERKKKRRIDFNALWEKEIHLIVKNLARASEEDIERLNEFIKPFVGCQKCMERYDTNALLDCPKNRAEAEKLLEEKPQEAWRSSRLRYCLAVIINERIKRREKG